MVNEAKIVVNKLKVGSSFQQAYFGYLFYKEKNT